ncbi:hypothetical protein PENSUB_12812 [Penicillium subrubescens]|uniref:Uncharacterized protein n=1 Tax=Penicillium subrubescens TaxID=1316194 RepID=A0A1Q5SWC1_9EURO|nr:hypothetical protein PENSUB_12812 [Penicillium subrubescens]
MFVLNQQAVFGGLSIAAIVKICYWPDVPGARKRARQRRHLQASNMIGADD